MSTPLTAALAAVLTLAAPSGSPSPAASHATVVHIRDFAFVPKTVTIDAGTTLRIVNDDSEAHTATALDRSFDSAGLDTNESWTHVFGKPGTYAYVCDLHPYMKGVIIVRPIAAKAKAKGSP